MKKSFFSKHRKITALLFACLFFTGNVFGQAIPGEDLKPNIPALPEVILDTGAEDGAEIFPFDFVAGEGRFVEYTEDLYEVTNAGVYDSEGNLIEISDEDMVDEDYKILEEELKETVSEEEKSAFEAYRESIISNWGGKKAFTEHRLKGLQENLEQEKYNFKNLGKEIGSIEEKLEPIHKEIETLKQQIKLLNDQIMLSKEKITNAELLIAEKQIKLKDLLWGLKKSEIELNSQRRIVLDYILLVYQEEEKFLDYFDEGSSTLKLLLADNSVSENLLGQDYSQILEKTGREVFYDLHIKKMVLDGKREVIQREQSNLENLYTSLSDERRILEEGRQTQKDLLEETRGEEERYQQLLEASIQQQLESAIAIQNIQDNIQFIEQKLDLLDESLEKVEELANDPERAEDLESLEDEIEDSETVMEDGYESALGEEVEKHLDEDASLRFQEFIWPVEPKAVTSYFEDPTYPKRWGVHKAIDIRAKQYTEIVAPANSYVFQTKDNGKGYSYIILAHKNNLITVYGHVTEFIAKPGTVVKQGEVIGLSGGTPGTKGAGWQTTGPHLHFEVWHKGKQVNPLDHLPVHELPIEYIPNKYLKEV